MSKAFGSPRYPNWLRSGLYRAQVEKMSDEQSEIDAGASNMSELNKCLGPEAIKMKDMAEAMKLSKFETAQLIAQGSKIDRDVELKERKIREAIKSREASLQAEHERAAREQERWERLIERDTVEKEAFREISVIF